MKKEFTGADLRARREQLGLSQLGLAELLDTTQNTISRWEIGERRIEKPEMLRLALIGLERELKRKGS